MKKELSFTEFLQEDVGTYDIKTILENLMEDQVIDVVKEYNELLKDNAVYTAEEKKAFENVINKGYVKSDILELIN